MKKSSASSISQFTLFKDAGLGFQISVFSVQVSVFRFQISRFSLLTPDTKKYEQKNLSLGAGAVKKSVNYFMAKMKDGKSSIDNHQSTIETGITD